MQTEGNTKKALQIDPEFRSLLPTLTTEESAALEESIEREGCRDALIVWGDTLVDGHNRHEICTRRGFPFDKKWEMCRGLGLSFGYNQNEGEETVLSGRNLVRILVEYVSHNGNLLINVGPRADGTIPEIQVDRLKKLGAWLKQHGEAIYGTRPWMERQQDALPGGATAFYTRKGRDLYAIVDGLAAGTTNVKPPIADTSLPVDVRDEYPIHVKLEGFFL